MASILLAEDSPTHTALIRSILEDDSHSVRCVGDGQQAMEAIVECRPDLVVTDLRMPEMNGQELVQQLAQRFADIPSIVVRSAQISGILAPLIAVSVVMQQILSLLGAQEVIGNFVTSMGGYYPVLFTAMAMVFVAGMILESLPVTIILAPILAPIASSVGVDPVHFSVIFLVGASIGFITPPYGLNLYVASGVTGVPYFKLLRYSTMYLFALLAIWILVALIPDLALALLPNR